MPLTRRNLLELVSSSTFFLTVAPLSAAAPPPMTMKEALTFPQGVASGDPQPEGVMLWTRAVPAVAAGGEAAALPLLLQLGADSNFSNILLQSQVHTSPSSDYTVRTYIDGLTPDTYYYYRFIGGGDSVSRTGRTRTAPSPDQARKVNLAFASCQNFEQGHYGSWARMLEDDRKAPEDERIHFVLHLGDFIYERSWHTRVDGSGLSRRVPPFPHGQETEDNRYAISLADYRHLYQTYLSDPHLQAARARWPFVCTWDDHEFANDNFQSFSTYGNTPVLEPQRKLSSSQAWFEYIPAVLEELEGQPAHDFKPTTLRGDAAAQNNAALDSLRIYRKLGWGKHLDIVLTDSRSYRSPPCLEDGFAATLGLPLNPVELVAITDAGSAYDNGNPPDHLPYGDGTIANPARDRAPGSILGQQQRQWFVNTLQTSAAKWKLWANALPLLPLRLDTSSLPLTDYPDSIFNIDGWAGFPYEVNYLMNELEEGKVSGVVSLSGDHHMHGAGTISRTSTGMDTPALAVDFSVAGLSSSPLLEDLIAVASKDHPDFASLVYSESAGQIEPIWNMAMVDGVFAAYAYAKTGMESLARWLGPNSANTGLRFVDTTTNGYGLACFDSHELRVEMVGMSDCRPDFKAAPAIKYVARFRLEHWAPGEPPQLEGPEFDGQAPFPFEV